MNKKVILFDFDGTLANTLPVIFSLLKEKAPQFGFKVPTDQDLESARGKTPIEIMRMFDIPLMKVPFLMLTMQKELSIRMKSVPLFPQIDTLIYALKKNGCVLGIVSSNNSANIELCIKKFNLSDCFSVIHSEKNIWGKGAVLKKLIHHHQWNTKEVVYVGDEVRDIEAAQQAGVDSIAVTWGFNTRTILEQYKPTFIVDMPEEIKFSIT